MVNLLAAILISAVLGFMAGHFSAKDNDPAPVSLKEAVTGEVDAPPAQFNLPRPPPAAKPPPKSAPVMCEQGKTLQEQIASLKFTEMKSICREAERNWKKLNIDGYVPFPAHGAETDRAIRDVFDMVKDSLATATFWRGEVSVALGEHSVQMEIFVHFGSQKAGGTHPPRDGAVTVENAVDLCIAISPFFVIDGKGKPTGSVSTCAGPLRKRGDSFYFLWETHEDDVMTPVMSAFLVPVPGASGSFEFLNPTGQWLSDPRFHWSASSFQEFQEATERHAKKIAE